MPTIFQAQQHYDWMKQQQDEAAAREAAARAQVAGYQSDEQKRQAQYAAERDALLHTYQSQAMNQQAGLNTQQAWTQGDIQSRLAAQGAQAQSALTQQQFGNQQALVQQQAGNQWNAAIQQKDLQAQLNQTMLTQSEEAEARRTKEAIAGVNRNPDLAPDEKNMLITQLQTKLNPLENRQRQASILHSQLQSQGLAQQNEQQATLFNQQQAWLAQGLDKQVVTFTDPITGRQQLFHRDAQGRINALDFSQSQAEHEMRMAQTGVGIAATLGSERRADALSPVQIANIQGHTNSLALSDQRASALHPGALTIQQLHANLMAAELRYGPNTQQAFDARQALTFAQVDDLTARTGISRQTLREMPARFNAWKELTDAQIGLTNGHIDSNRLNDIYRGLQITDLKDQVTRNPIMRDLDRQLHEANLGKAESNQARNWMTNQLLLMEIENGMAGGGPGGAGGGGAPGMPRVNVGGTGRVTVTHGIEHGLSERDLDHIRDNARNTVRDLNAARRQRGEPPLTETEMLAARTAEERRQISQSDSRRVVGGMTPAQIRQFGESLRNAPPAVRRALGITLNGPAQPFVGPPTPDPMVQQGADLGQDIGRLREDAVMPRNPAFEPRAPQQPAMMQGHLGNPIQNPPPRDVVTIDGQALGRIQELLNRNGGVFRPPVGQESWTDNRAPLPADAHEFVEAMGALRHDHPDRERIVEFFLRANPQLTRERLNRIAESSTDWRGRRINLDR